MTSNGKVSVEFSSDNYKVPDLSMIKKSTLFLSDLVKVDGRLLAEDLPVLSVEVIPGADSNATMLGFTWNVTAESTRNLDINLNFDHPEIVSIYSVSIGIVLNL